MKTKREEAIEIRNKTAQVAEGLASKETDLQVYRMFGSLSKEQAQGVVIGINFLIGELP